MTALFQTSYPPVEGEPFYRRDAQSFVLTGDVLWAIDAWGARDILASYVLRADVWEVQDPGLPAGERVYRYVEIAAS